MRFVRLIVAIAGTLVAAAVNARGLEIPCHGVFFEMTFSELFLLLWLPLAPIVLGTKDIPKRWLAYFGILSFIIMFFFTPFFDFIMTVYHSGRRFRLSELWPVKLLLFIIYFGTVPVITDAISKFLRKGRGTSCHSTNRQR